MHLLGSREKRDMKMLTQIHCTTEPLRSCVKVEVAVLVSPSLIVLNMVSVDVKQHLA